MKILELMSKIGINTMGDLARFKKEEQGASETLEQALTRYLKELGTNFRILEEVK